MVKRYRRPGYEVAMLLLLLMLPLSWPVFVIPWLLKRMAVKAIADELPEWVETLLITLALILNFYLVDYAKHLWA